MNSGVSKIKSPIKWPEKRKVEGKELQLFQKLERISTIYRKDQFEEGLKDTKEMAAEVEAAKKEGVDVKDIKRELTR